MARHYRRRGPGSSRFSLCGEHSSDHDVCVERSLAGAADLALTFVKESAASLASSVHRGCHVLLRALQGLGRRMFRILLRPQEGVQYQLFLGLFLEIILVKWLLHDPVELGLLRLLHLELLQVFVVVRVEDQHVSVCHPGEWILRVDDRTNQLLVRRVLRTLTLVFLSCQVSLALT